ncbi:MAG: AAC(3) family N-acetyltransferase [Anaerolineales bacterium]|nr:AAC(3) family N-acetyltransferase [Anaerolineales bacterium]
MPASLSDASRATPQRLKTALSKLGLSKRLVIAHASLKAFDSLDANVMLEALLASTRGLIMPAFTYKTMLNPEAGPPHNGMSYGSQADLNKLAEPFHPDMPVDKMMGVLPEVLRKHPKAKRSIHPIQSFVGINADALLNTQTIFEPLAPIKALAEQDGWVLLLGVDHTVNTSIHYCEKLAGRIQFIRWALTQDKVVECGGFPGDSDGFNAIAIDVEKYTRREEVGSASVQAIHLPSLLNAVIKKIRENPFALLCTRADCERCNAVRYG